MTTGIGGGWTRKQILKIMTDSRVGTYGVAVLILYTLTKVQLLTHLDTSHWDLCYYSTIIGLTTGTNSTAIHEDTCGGGEDSPRRMGCHGAGPALVVS